jgi:hypothetical protein
MTSYGIESSKLKAAKDKLPPIKLSSFIDPREPWVMVPNGSLLGFFDWVSMKFTSLFVDFAHKIHFTNI